MRRLVLLVAAVFVLAGCDTGTESPDPATAPATATASASESETAAPSPTASPVAAATPTDGPAPGDTLVLEETGLGLVDFGAAPDEVIEAVGARVGEPDEDSGWRPYGDFLDEYGICPGSELREVVWGQVSVLFTNESTGYTSEPVEHFFLYVVSDDDPATALGQGPLTAEGIGVGSTRAELEAAFGPDTLDVTPSDVEAGPTWSTYSDSLPVPSGLRGTLTDDTPEGLVASVTAGQACARE
jgi:hypothetical protein